MLFGLFFVGTLGFWLLVGLACIALVAAVEYSRPGWATLSVLGTLSLLSMFGNFNVFRAAANHPVVTLECALGYVLVGAFWSVAKWWFHVRSARECFDEEKVSWFQNHRPYRSYDERFTDARMKAQKEFDKAAPGNTRDWAKAELSSALENENAAKLKAEIDIQKEFGKHAKLNLIPSAKREKSRIMTWMMYWPWSASWTLINDPVKRAFTAVYDQLRALFDGIVKRAFKGIDLEETDA